jgi:hypothetical protein
MEPSAEEVRAMLRRIDVEGWEGSAGRRLLEVARVALARPAVRRTGLAGAAAAQAEASAWTAAWDALRRPAARLADSPLGMARVAAQRAAWAEVRLARPGDAHGVQVISIDAAYEAGHDVADADADAASVRERACELGSALDAIHAALVTGGWQADALREALELLADHARRGRREHPQAPWRWVALRLGLPEWRVRRLAVLMLGREGLPGLLAQVHWQGAPVLASPPARDAVASTCRHWMPSPEGYLAELAAGTPTGQVAS